MEAQDSKSIFNYPQAPLNSDEWPAVTIISVCFIGIWVLLIIFLKIMTSAEEYFDDNKFDLEFYVIIVATHLSPIEVPAYNNERCRVPINNRTKKEAHEFTPVPTVVGFIFIGAWLGFILIAKIMYNSSDQYKINNRYDLVIFKPAAKNSLIGPRRIYSNNNVNSQNINAAATSGIDLSVLHIRNSYNSVSNTNTNENGNFNSSTK